MLFTLVSRWPTCEAEAQEKRISSMVETLQVFIDLVMSPLPWRNIAKLQMKVVEKTGRSIKKELVKSNPFKKIGCEKGLHRAAQKQGMKGKPPEVLGNVSLNT